MVFSFVLLFGRRLCIRLHRRHLVQIVRHIQESDLMVGLALLVHFVCSILPDLRNCILFLFLVGGGGPGPGPGLGLGLGLD
jgi:hypothetical protein